MNKLKQQLRDNLLSHLSDHNTEANVNIAYVICDFCAKNYIYLEEDKWTDYPTSEEDITTEELFNKFLEQYERL